MRLSSEGSAFVRVSCVFMIAMVLFIKVNKRKTRVIKTSLLGSYLNLNKRVNEFSISFSLFTVEFEGREVAPLIMAAERFQSRLQNSFQLQFVLVENKKQNQVFNYFLFQSMTLAPTARSVEAFPLCFNCKFLWFFVQSSFNQKIQFSLALNANLANQLFIEFSINSATIFLAEWLLANVFVRR